jgi:hypothetical protein
MIRRIRKILESAADDVKDKKHFWNLLTLFTLPVILDTLERWHQTENQIIGKIAQK